MAHHNGHAAGGLCVECEVPQLARNHYFTGKLLVERDFTDEQRYYIGKDRRHNQRLHGAGVVCGLRVDEHPNEACRTQWVIVEPGSAIDCCGREIVVPEPQYVDLRGRFIEAWHEKFGAESSPDDNSHLLQLCVRYDECGSEEVPAIFDECTADGDFCQPNRILERYVFEAQIDPEVPTSDPRAPKLEWSTTINVARPRRVALGGDRVFVLTDEDPATLYVFDAANQRLLDSYRLPARAFDLDVRQDGSRVYVSVDEADAVLVLDPLELGADPIVNRLPIGDPAGADVRVAVAGDGLVAVESGAQPPALTVWDGTINEPLADPTTARVGNPVDLGAEPEALDVSADSDVAFVASGGDARVDVIDLAGPTAGTPIDLPAGTVPISLDVVETTAGRRLFIGDDAGHVRLLDLGAAATTQLGDVDVGARPMGLVASPGGRWLYVLRAAQNGEATLVSVDVHRVETGGGGPALSGPVPVGETAAHLRRDGDGTLLYAATTGPAEYEGGGVALVKVTEEECRDLLTRTVDGCPDCDDECVVLATVSDYNFGARFDQARIDNLVHRHLLPSTDVLTEVIECMLDHGVGVGKTGPQGPPGRPGEDGQDGQDGEDGKGIDDAEVVETLPPGSDPKADLVDRADGTRWVEFRLPTTEQAKALALPKIVAINWPHGREFDTQSAAFRRLNEQGLVIGFDRLVLAETLDDFTYQVLVSGGPGKHGEATVFCFCNLAGIVRGIPKKGGPITWAPKCQQQFPGKVPAIQYDRSKGEVLGARFRPAIVRPDGQRSATPWTEGEYRVVLKGDFVLGNDTITLPDGREVNPALDGNHMGPGLPHRCPAGDAVEGGQFESWFRIVKRDLDPG
jgi:DNA-binding beta-propeller fold protein YncE